MTSILVSSCPQHHAGDLVVSSNCEHDPSNLATQNNEIALFSYRDPTPVSCDTPQDSSPVAAPIVNIENILPAPSMNTLPDEHMQGAHGGDLKRGESAVILLDIEESRE